MKKTIITLTTSMVLSVASYAGGKMVHPVEAEVVPVPAVINPIPLYIGLGVVAAGLERDPCPCDNLGETKDLRYGVVLRAGWDINDYVGLEARALKTFGTDVFSETSHYGLYLKPQYHITEQANIYALLGYGKTVIDYTNGIKSSTTDESGFSYGLGFEYDFASDESQGQYSRAFDGQGDQEEGWGLWVDFQHLLNNKGMVHTDSNVATAGITYDF